jgi:hypothetical protein
MRCVQTALLGLAALICISLSTPDNVQAYTGDLRIPPEGVTQVITLEDGSSLVGRITEIRADQIKFQTDLGEITIGLAKIESIKEPKKETKKETTKEITKTEEVPQAPSASAPAEEKNPDWFPNPNRTRLLIGPTARTLEARKGYLYDLWIFFPGVAYGITDNFMISVGASVIPDAEDQMFYIMPKVGFPASKQVDLAASLMVFRLWDETFYFGMGSMTYGTDDQSITGGLGIAFKDDEMADAPAAMLGGEYRMGRRASLVGESWFIPGNDDGMLGFGAIRLMGELMTVDLGVALAYENRSGEVDFDGNPEEDEVDWLPYIDFVWNF